jgi:transcription elongation factor GreA
MASSNDHIPSLGEAAALYLAKLSSKVRDASQPEVYRFARWYGWESPFSRMAGPAVASYAEQLSVSDTDYARKFEIIRAFLAYAKKVGWSATNLATHLKTRKARTGPAIASGRSLPDAVSLSQQRYDELTAELENLKKKSRELVGEMQRAAADKDFRENAPLDAAREERGHVEGRIKELKQTLKAATIIEEKKEPALKSSVGDSIVLHDLASGEELRYMIVDPREVDASRGKISQASPLGKALIGKRDGEIVEITAPAGKLRYQIKRIER